MPVVSPLQLGGQGTQYKGNSTLINLLTPLKQRGGARKISLEDYVKGLIDALTVHRNRDEVVLEVTRASTYKLLHELLPNMSLSKSEEPFIDNIDGKVVAGYRIRIRHDKVSDNVKDVYDYLAGCIDAKLESVKKDENGKIVLLLGCRNPRIRERFNVEADEHGIVIKFDVGEASEKILPRLRNKYMVYRIEAVLRGDYRRYYDVIREEAQADEVLRQLAIEEILFSSRREEYERILSIRPEEARFRQRLLKELVGCGR